MEKSRLDYIVHLRLHFQFLLSSIFLWGCLLASGKVDSPLLLAYVAFHLFGYAGGTALNSYYDRDEGPIGGLADPPPVPAHLLAFSLVWQTFGFLIVLGVNLSCAAVYVIMFGLSVAYSHPRTRWKGKPVLALVTVALGQGVLAFLGGWSAARGELLSAINPPAVLGILAATLLTVGLYPLTEIYQIEEDGRRGDMTLARALGVPGSFRWATICLALGGTGAVWIAAARFTAAEALVLVPFIAILVAWVQMWAARFERQSIVENYRTAMRLYTVTSLPLLAWIVFHLLFQ